MSDFASVSALNRFDRVNEIQHHVNTVVIIVIITDKTHWLQYCIYSQYETRNNEGRNSLAIINILMKNFNRRRAHGHHGSKRRELVQHAHSRGSHAFTHTHN